MTRIANPEISAVRDYKSQKAAIRHLQCRIQIEGICNPIRKPLTRITNPEISVVRDFKSQTAAIRHLQCRIQMMGICNPIRKPLTRITNPEISVVRDFKSQTAVGLQILNYLQFEILNLKQLDPENLQVAILNLKQRFALQIRKM